MVVGVCVFVVSGEFDKAPGLHRCFAGMEMTTNKTEYIAINCPLTPPSRSFRDPVDGNCYPLQIQKIYSQIPWDISFSQAGRASIAQMGHINAV
jgi:hypothetical protein